MRKYLSRQALQNATTPEGDQASTTDFPDKELGQNAVNFDAKLAF